MTLREANPELSLRWSEQMLCHDRRGVHGPWPRRVPVVVAPGDTLESEFGKGSEFIVRVPSSVGYREVAS